MIDLVDLLGKALPISEMDLFQVLMKKKKKGDNQAKIKSSFVFHWPRTWLVLLHMR